MNMDILLEDWPFPEARDLEPSDPRLDEIVTLAHGGDYAGAADRSEAVIAEGILDIRLVCFLLYGTVWEAGPAGMVDAFTGLQAVLQRHWEFLGPRKGREKHLATSLSWLLRQSYEKTFRYEEERESERWTDWMAELDPGFPSKLAEATEHLRAALQERLATGEGPLFDLVNTLQSWSLRLGDRLDSPQRGAEPLLAVEPGPDRAAPSTSPTTPSRLELGTSYHLEVLIRKLTAFERLIEAEKFSRAALLMDDINTTLSEFDPRLFFPLLFQRYSALLVQHIGEISGYEEYRGSPEWQAMQELLKVDIDGFVDL